ncbi:MAG: hypothetical protein HY291_00460 [Planctomycetes bacterium]|nr:hypothetical protein [Planctomycetota bacterium]
MKRTWLPGLLAAVLILSAQANAWGEDAPAPEKAQANFEASYKAGVDAVGEKDWATAEVMLESALKALGPNDHPNKLAAQTLLEKAKGINKKTKEIRDTLHAADEMLKLKQWPEAKQLYEKAGQLGADPEAVKKGVATAAAGEAGTGAAAEALKADQSGKDYETLIKDGMAKLEKKDYTGARTSFTEALKLKPNDAVAYSGLREAEHGLGINALTPAEAKTTATPEPAKAEPLALPEPKTLAREDWEQGAGSATLWAADLLHLNEGDEKFRRPLKGDFAVSVAIEARMDEQSIIYLDLRPDKGGKKLPVLRGYGSKAGSAPFLLVDKETAGKGKAQPGHQQITLSFRRTGDRIEFFCDGEKVGESWALPKDTSLWLWCCGKGDMNGAKLEGGK